MFGWHFFLALATQICLAIRRKTDFNSGFFITIKDFIARLEIYVDIQLLSFDPGIRSMCVKIT